MLIEKIKENKSLIFNDISQQKQMAFSSFNLGGYNFDVYQKSLVILYLDNTIDSIEVFFGFMASKHALAMLSLDLAPTLKNELEESYSPQFIYDKSRDDIAGYTLQNDIFIKDNANDYPIDPQIKVLLSTSGTTGSPKFVKLSEQNLLQNALSIIDYLPIVQTDVCPLNLPIYYSYGLSILTTNAISGGAIVCGIKDVLNKDFWVDFEKLGFTSLAGVPYVYEILHRIGFTKKSYPSLRYLTQAGGKLNEKLVRVFHEYVLDQNIDFFVMYGQTEATARMSYFNTQKYPDKIGTVGQAIHNGSFEVDYETNELIYNGPNVFGGYATGFTDLNEYHHTGKLRTGDIALIDEDNFVSITGRLKRFVKILGSRINLDEIEQALKNQFGSVTFVCVGKEDQFLQIVSTSGAIEKTEVSTFIKEYFKIHPAYIRYRYLDTIPLTANGKINYNALTE
jgi:long-chain acyl-CoA synthetase